MSNSSPSNNIKMPLEGFSPPDGKLKVLVVPVYPKDKKKKSGLGEIIDTWEMVKKYYSQASYGKIEMSVDYAKWRQLSGDSATYVTNDKKNSEAPNIKYDKDNDHATQKRLWSEAAHAAEGQKMADGRIIKVNDYHILVCIINLDGNNGNPIRGYGGYSWDRFEYKDDTTKPPLNINIQLDNPMWLIVLDEQAGWGHSAHEVGHCLLPNPFPADSNLSEDLYSDTGVDSTAEGFDLMGNHEESPLFSGYDMEMLKYYEGGQQVNEISWKDTETFNHTFEVAAHGKEINNVYGRYNLVKINVTDGLCYYIEVRQRPTIDETTEQVYDTCINLGKRRPGLSDEANVGGVVVTQVLTGPMVSTNQVMRSITLLHNQERLTTEKFEQIKNNNTVDPRLPHVLKGGNGDDNSASDPMRGITITALEPIVDRPLTYKVKIEWDKTRLGMANGTIGTAVIGRSRARKTAYGRGYTAAITRTWMTSACISIVSPRRAWGIMVAGARSTLNQHR
jgi:hypothetical protein